jgi:uncharacterized protein YerC
MNTIKAETHTKVARMILSGVPLVDIRETESVSNSTIYAVKKELGLSNRKWHLHLEEGDMAFHGRAIPEEMAEEVVKLFRQGKSVNTIHFQTRLSRYYIYKVVDRAGLSHEHYTVKGRGMELGKRDNFTCSHNCSWCKHQFQHPCPLALQDSSFEYNNEVAPTMFDLRALTKL